jgi:hypothetical protein
MQPTFSFTIVFGLTLLVANLWVSANVIRNPLSSQAQKAYQCVLVWLVPVLGAAIIWSFLPSEATQKTDVLEPPFDHGVSGPEFDRPGVSHGADS